MKTCDPYGNQFQNFGCCSRHKCNVRSRFGISWYFTVIFWFLQAKTPLRDECKKYKNESRWTNATCLNSVLGIGNSHLSKNILLLVWGCGCPSTSKLALQDWGYYCTRAAHCNPVPIHSFSNENNHATTFGPSGWTETRDLDGLNLLAILTANVKRKYPPEIPTCKMGMATVPSKEQATKNQECNSTLSL